MPIDYSKWNNIEISDDEDDTHPNVDTPSLFKWRHEARVQRAEDKEKEDKARAAKIKQQALKVKQIKAKANATTDEAERTKLEESLSSEEKQHADFLAKEEEIRAHEEKYPRWDVDNISKEKFSKTLINKGAKEKKSVQEETDDIDSLQTFIETYQKEYKHFGMLSKFKDSQTYLRENINIVSPHTASALLLWALDLEQEGKSALAERILHQTLIINYICEVAKTSNIDPRDAMPGFFKRIIQAQELKADYMLGFNEELQALVKRVKERAVVRKQEQLQQQKEQEEQEAEEVELTPEQQEKERQERIANSPGGLDPQEVYESLPRSLQECFETQDIGALQKCLHDMPVEEAKKWMRMCADSGLWVPADRSVLE